MKAHTTAPGFLFGACLVSLSVLASSAAYADVKYRLGYDATTSEYSVYMTPDSVPNPDILVSSQVTLVAPVQSGMHFVVQNMQSFVPELVWNIHSRVNTPSENTASDYISFGSISTGSMPQPFGWVVGQEKKIFSFTNASGCVKGAGLLVDADPFNIPSNSAQTNPGNYFSNLGWSDDNNYAGNYGGVVSCLSGSVKNNKPDRKDHNHQWPDLKDWLKKNGLGSHSRHDGKKNDRKGGGNFSSLFNRKLPTPPKRPTLYQLP